jgi:hypothetical protein
MSKIRVSAGLCLGLLASYCSVGKAVEPNLPAQSESFWAIQSVAPMHADSHDEGQFERYTDAIPTRDHWRRMGYAANIVRTEGYVGGKYQEYYTVRVFAK